MKKMHRFSLNFILIICVISSVIVFAQSGESDTGYLSWNSKQIERVGKAHRKSDAIGKTLSFRVFDTERAYNYDLRVTLMTPEMIRASARFQQLRNRLSDDQTKALVKEAEEAGDLVAMIEIDPSEGSGVIPLDWRVFLQPKGLANDAEGAVAGVKSPHLRKVKALGGVFRRDYDFDLFFVSFPLVDENKEPLISPDLAEIEVYVGVYKSEGRVSWRLPESVREKIRFLSSEKEEIK